VQSAWRIAECIRKSGYQGEGYRVIRISGCGYQDLRVSGAQEKSQIERAKVV